MRRNNASRYRSLFEEMGLSKCVSAPDDSARTHLQSICLSVSRPRPSAVLPARKRRRNRSLLSCSAASAGMLSSPRVPEQEIFRKLTRLHGESLALPIYPEITEEQQRVRRGKNRGVLPLTELLSLSLIRKAASFRKSHQNFALFGRKCGWNKLCHDTLLDCQIDGSKPTHAPQLT